MSVKEKKNSLELAFGLSLAVIAALLAINELFASKYGSTELKTTNERSQSYQWYQAKSIKKNLLESHRETLQSFLDYGVIDISKTRALIENIENLNRQIQKYSKEQREILVGSKKVGKENWSQAINGRLGQVIGALELEEELTKLQYVLNQFDHATLFLQLALLIGAIGIVIRKYYFKLTSLTLTIILGLCGTAFHVIGFQALN